MKFKEMNVGLRLILGIYIFFFISCDKYLSEKNRSDLAIPSTIFDYQAILDDIFFVNNYRSGVGVLGADEYYIPLSTFNGFTEQLRNLYTWQGDDWFKSLNGWTRSYDNVYRANSVLEGCNKITRTNENGADWDNLKGQALFLRGSSFFEVASGWTIAYDAKSAKNTLGIPLRLNTDFNERSVRSNLEETYNRMISDLKGAIPLLPTKPVHIYRASRPAACCELARVYMAMRMYDSCYVYADKALSMFNTLLDFNDLDTSITYPISRFGPQVIYQTQLTFQFTPYNFVDSTIFGLFEPNDLRKAVFFNKTAENVHSFQSFNGAFVTFGGIAGDEMYLMRAECLARQGKFNSALDDLNHLLSKRYIKGSFQPYVLNDKQQVLNLILLERKKELLFRGLRLMDIKRLNMEGYNISVTRVVDGKTYTLKPNDPRFAMQIPKKVIIISGMQQNPL